MSSKAIRMSPEEEKIVREILTRHLPDSEVWVFGSRIGDSPKPYSDLDLMVRESTALPAQTVIALKEAFEESDLPFQVDLIEWATTSGKFRDIVSANYLIIQPGRRQE